MLKVYVFKSLPPFLWGYTRDIRAMWALEECGIPYETVGLDCGPNGLQDETWFEELNPFKQVPTIDDDGYVLTESGAILLYLAEKSGKLIPSDLQGRAQVYRWLITSLNNIEPFALPIFFADLQGDSNPPMKALRPWHVGILDRFFPAIDQMLKTQPFVTGTEFTVADIALTGVLRELRKTEILRQYPNIENYRRRCEERPAFVKVLNAYEDRLGIARGSAR
ncbi:glutathione S-transferase family protein [Bdellovibrio sp. 22V]|uniref:glutathione S-transferase family protein n=1 Tax=Bdellovibrio sp. 22V TaxID=3044166 RepID=UPI002543E719|nr:glutathione S-transferase family protein [Bdellovibrio sp. 22V]WII72347.1 glutathione S-transferase family protein [Bdellovibrio sp. 22V]